MAAVRRRRQHLRRAERRDERVDIVSEFVTERRWARSRGEHHGAGARARTTKERLFDVAVIVSENPPSERVHRDRADVTPGR